MEAREVQWAALYQDLLALLGARGENDFLGEKDYWLVDDDWGGYQQKVCIHNPDLLNQGLVDEIQNLLRASALEWQVIVTLELPNCQQQGIAITAGNVHHHWDLAALRQQLNRPQFFL